MENITQGHWFGGKGVEGDFGDPSLLHYVLKLKI